MEPKNISISLKTGEKLFAWYLNPERSPRAVILLCHGWGEHSLRYLHWAEKFIKQEYAFFSWDHIGHGQSEGRRGHIPSYQTFMEEVNLMINKANEIYPSAPVVLYGHSMGGNIAINFALRESNPFKLLIATSPWLRLTQKQSPILTALVKVLNKTFCGLQINAPLDANGISHIPEEVEKYKTDPLNHGKITPRLVTEIASAGEYALSNIHKLTKPFLLLHGDSDPIVSFEATSELHSKCSSCSFIPFGNMYHELHNETVKEDVFNIIKEWLSGNIE
jgi:acylglycerol lipase